MSVCKQARTRLEAAEARQKVLAQRRREAEIREAELAAAAAEANRQVSGGLSATQTGQSCTTGADTVTKPVEETSCSSSEKPKLSRFAHAKAMRSPESIDHDELELAYHHVSPPPPALELSTEQC